MNTSPTVYLVDDDPAVRDSLSMLIEHQGLPVVACESAEGFLAIARPGNGCAIVDLRMPGMDGLALQQQMTERGLNLPVVILTGHGDIPASVKAIKQGAVDFLTKPVGSGVLLASVRAAIEESLRVHAQAVAACGSAERLASLTTREREVMTLMIDGLPNKEIARALCISHRTVEIHRARVMQKMGVQSVLRLAQLVLRQ